jgi:ATP-dependent Clp protease ATP-binding subunit ClpC
LKITYLEAKIFKSDIIGTEHLLLAILRDEDNIASQILQQYNVTYDIFKSEVEQNRTTIKDEARALLPATMILLRMINISNLKKFRISNPKPGIGQLGRDLTKAAEEGKLILLWVARKKLSVYLKFYPDARRTILC